MVLFAVAQRKENKWCCSLSLKEKKWCCSLPKNSKKRKEMVLFFFCLFQEPLFFCCFASKNSKKRKENLFFLLFFLFLKQTLIFLKQINKTWFSETKEQPAVLETSSNEPLFSRNKHCVSSFSWNKTWFALLWAVLQKRTIWILQRKQAEENSLLEQKNRTAFLNRRTEQKKSGSWNKQPLFSEQKNRTASGSPCSLVVVKQKVFLEELLVSRKQMVLFFSSSACFKNRSSFLLLVSRTAQTKEKNRFFLSS